MRYIFDGKKLAALRKKRQLSSKELARLIGCSGVAIWQWEKGESAPSRISVELLTEALKCSPNSLFSKAGL